MAEATKKRRAAPKGYEKANSEVTGYWTEDEPLYFTPKSVKLMDGNIQKIKPSIIIVGELLEPTILKNKDSDPFEGRMGDVVGVWYKPGMKGIELCAGLKTWLDLDLDEKSGEQKVKDVGKGNPMNLYTLSNPPGSKKTRLPIIEDVRDKSRQVATPFDNPDVRSLRRRPETATGAEAADENDVDDHIPF